MPSWNIHTAHVERLLAGRRADQLGIADVNAFLFGSYVPDIYVGFMVPDATFRLDYCVTHLAQPHTIPLPDADRFWDDYVCHPWRRPTSPAGFSLALGVWAHLVADCLYNRGFRAFCEERGESGGDELRRRKQADFALFGHSLGISSVVDVTPGLLETARSFRQYSVLPADVERAVAVAGEIVGEGAVEPSAGDYQLLSAEWMAGAFAACDDFLASWLSLWTQLGGGESSRSSADLRAEGGFGPQP